MKRNFIVTNSGLIYACTELILRWRGIKPTSTLYTFYTNVVDELDEFLFDNDVEINDSVIFIGFNEGVEDEIRKHYPKFKKFKFLNNTDDTNPLFRAVKSFPDMNKLPNSKKKFIKHALEWAKMDFTKESYYLSLCFRCTHQVEFVDIFQDGYHDYVFKPYLSSIKRILDTVKNQKTNLLRIANKYYFVNATVKNLDDYVYKYIPLYGNISVVDLKKGRVYMRKKAGSKVNIKGFSEKVLSETVGYECLCSGNVTEDFVKLLKRAEKVC